MAIAGGLHEKNYSLGVCLMFLLLCSPAVSVSPAFADSAVVNPLTGKVVVYNFGHAPSSYERASAVKEVARKTIKDIFESNIEAQVKLVKKCLGR